MNVSLMKLLFVLELGWVLFKVLSHPKRIDGFWDLGDCLMTFLLVQCNPNLCSVTFCFYFNGKFLIWFRKKTRKEKSVVLNSLSCLKFLSPNDFDTNFRLMCRLVGMTLWIKNKNQPITRPVGLMGYSRPGQYPARPWTMNFWWPWASNKQWW